MQKKVEKHCARELFKGSNGSASLLALENKLYGWGLQFFCE